MNVDDYTTMVTLQLVVGALLVLILGVAILGSLCRQHATDVYAVFYIFSLSLVITSLLIFWGDSSGAFDERGNLQGPTGLVLKSLKEHATDPTMTAAAFGAAAAALVVPQLCAYLLCAPFGCASKPLLVQTTISFLVWGSIKFFVVLAGITAAVSAFLPKLPASEPPPLTTVVFFFFSLLILFLYRNGERVFSRLFARLPAAVRNRTSAAHKWATRFRQPTQGSSTGSLM